jgi:hypothetical protein
VVSPNVAGGIGLNLSVKMGQDQGYPLLLCRANKEGKAWVYLDWQEPVEDGAVHPPGGPGEFFTYSARGLDPDLFDNWLICNVPGV